MPLLLRCQSFAEICQELRNLYISFFFYTRNSERTQTGPAVDNSVEDCSTAGLTEYILIQVETWTDWASLYEQHPWIDMKHDTSRSRTDVTGACLTFKSSRRTHSSRARSFTSSCTRVFTTYRFSHQKHRLSDTARTLRGLESLPPNSSNDAETHFEVCDSGCTSRRPLFNSPWCHVTLDWLVAHNVDVWEGLSVQKSWSKSALEKQVLKEEV